MKRSDSSGKKDKDLIVQRGNQLAQGSRDGGDRRGGGRGLDVGRRLVDHRRVRSEFLKRIQEMTALGLSPSTMAHILNDEEYTTAHGESWTEAAIQQLLEVTYESARKAAWSPFERDKLTSADKELGSTSADEELGSTDDE